MVASNAGLYDHHSETWQLLLGMFVLGLGVGVALSTMPLLLLGAVPGDQLGSSMAANGVLRQVGGSIASAMVGALLAAHSVDGLATDEGFRWIFGIGGGIGAALTIWLLWATYSVTFCVRHLTFGRSLEVFRCGGIRAPPVVRRSPDTEGSGGDPMSVMLEQDHASDAEYSEKESFGKIVARVLMLSVVVTALIAGLYMAFGGNEGTDPLATGANSPAATGAQTARRRQAGAADLRAEGLARPPRSSRR